MSQSSALIVSAMLVLAILVVDILRQKGNRP